MRLCACSYSRYVHAAPYGICQHSTEYREGVKSKRPAGTDMPAEQAELAPTRHPLGMLIKVKVVNICEERSHPSGFPAQVAPFLNKQAAFKCVLLTDPPHFIPYTLHMGPVVVLGSYF